MPYAVTLLLDPDCTARIRGLWQALARERLSDSAVSLNYDPHVTLAIHDDTADPAVLSDGARSAASGWNALPVTCAALAVFPATPSTLWIAPTVTTELLRAHAELCAALPSTSLHAHYRPGTWMPHITLADDLGAGSIGAALTTSAAAFRPFVASLDRIEVVSFRPVIRLWQGRLHGAPR